MLDEQLSSIELKTVVPGPNSQHWLERKRQAVPRSLGAVLPVFVQSAHGAIVEDIDGNRFLDFAGGIGCMNVGHSSVAVVDAIREQAAQFQHTCFMVAPYKGYVELAEELNRRVPGDFPKKTVLLNSGAEAVENAIKIARSYTGRPAVIAFEDGFHGRTLLTMTLTSKTAPYKSGFGPYAPEIYRMPYAYCYRCSYNLTYPECKVHCASKLEDMFARYVESGSVAAVIFEPILGEGGFVVPPPEWFHTIASICRKHGIVVIADEVQTGIGRTGSTFMCEQVGLEPDLLVSAKSLSAGLPLGAVTGRAEMMDAPGPGQLGGTFGGNPISCAAALAALNTLDEQGLCERAQAFGEAFRSASDVWQRRFPLIGDVRGAGAMQAIELVLDRVSRKPAREAAQKVLAACQRRGLIVLTAGVYGNVVRLLAPLVVTFDQIEEGLNILEAALDEVQREFDSPQLKEFPVTLQRSLLRLTAACLLAPVTTIVAQDTLFVHGHIYTGGPQAHFVDAMLLRNERIVAAGDRATVERLALGSPRIVDLHHQTVLPGLIDTHTHSMDWAVSIVRSQLDLRYPAVKSIADIQAKIRERAAMLKPGEWIQGAAWDDSKLAENRYITRQELDAAAPNNPVYLEHVTGHLSATNSLALRLAHIDATTPDPSGGLIQRDAAGQPTGIVKDNAMNLFDAVLPAPSNEDWIAAAAYLSKACNHYGLTSIHDVALLAPAISAYQQAEKRGLLTVRVEMAPLVSSEADVQALLFSGVHTGFGDDWLKFGAVKFFSDGGMAARTIAIYPPGPAGDEKNIGLLLWKPEDLQRLQLLLATHGWQLSTHAIGDRAIDEVLDSYAKVAAALPNRDLRNRVIHDGIATPAIQARLVSLHVYVDNNPPFVYFLGKHFKHYGAERLRWAYPGKSYFDHGIIASGGSDTYVTPISPWWGIWAAVVRKDQSSGDILAPEERLTVEQAIQEYTWNGALAGFDEQNKGSLEAGKLADFIVLDRDIFTRPVDELKDVNVLQTWIGGREVFHAASPEK